MSGAEATFWDPLGGVRFDLPVGWACDLVESSLARLLFRHWRHPSLALDIRFVSLLLPPGSAEKFWRNAAKRQVEAASAVSQDLNLAAGWALRWSDAGENGGRCGLRVRSVRWELAASCSAASAADFNTAWAAIDLIGSSLEIEVGSPSAGGQIDKSWPSLATTFGAALGSGNLEVATQRAIVASKILVKQAESSKDLFLARAIDALLRRAVASVERKAWDQLAEEALKTLKMTIALEFELCEGHYGVEAEATGIVFLRAIEFQREAARRFDSGDLGGAFAAARLSAADFLTTMVASTPLSAVEKQRVLLQFVRHALAGAGAYAALQGRNSSLLDIALFNVDAGRYLSSLGDLDATNRLIIDLIWLAENLMTLPNAEVVQVADALREAEKLFKTRDDWRWAWWCLADAQRLYLDQQLEAASARLDEARSVKGLDADPELGARVELAAGGLLLDSGRVNQAVAVYEEVLSSGFKLDPESRLTIADAFKRHGEKERALELLAQLIVAQVGTSSFSQTTARAFFQAGLLLGQLGDDRLGIYSTMVATLVLDMQRALPGSSGVRIAIDDLPMSRLIQSSLIQLALTYELNGYAALAADHARAESLLIERDPQLWDGWEEVACAPPSDSLSPRDAITAAGSFVLCESENWWARLQLAGPMDEEEMQSLVDEVGHPFLILHPVLDVLHLFLMRPGLGCVARKAAASAEDIRRHVAFVQDALEIRSSSRGTEGSAAPPKLTGLETELSWLWTALIGPVAETLTPGTPLCILPYRDLWAIPYNLLMDPKGDFLIDSHPVWLAPSIRSVAALRNRRAGGKWVPSKAYIAGNPTLDPTLKLDPLPGADAEAEAVCMALKPLLEPDNLVFKRAGEATELSFLREGQGADLVHLSCHAALAVPASASALYLTASPGHDGRVFPEDVRSLTLRDALVFLSACETGLGRLTADGIVGLSRAFLEAGGSAIVMSLWSVSDASTTFLVKSFYQGLLEKNLSVAEALQAATLEVRSKLRAGAIRDEVGRPLPDHPGLWGAFVALGDPVRFRRQ